MWKLWETLWKKSAGMRFLWGICKSPTPNLLGQGDVWYEWNVSAPLYSWGQKSPLQGGAALSKKDTDPFLI
jgi:hypothetical protein